MDRSTSLLTLLLPFSIPHGVILKLSSLQGMQVSYNISILAVTTFATCHAPKVGH